MLPITNEDFSRSQCNAALQYLANRAEHYVLLVYVIERPLVRTGKYGYDDMMREFSQERKEIAERILSRAAQRLHGEFPEIAVEKVIVQGQPLAELLRLRYEKRIDLIVVAKKAKNAFMRFLQASFCDKLAQRVRCDVVVAESRFPYEPRVIATRVNADRA